MNTPSAYQSAIWRDIAEGRGHTVVVARAGSGKTTTIMEGLKSVPKGLSSCMFAFNKAIAEELRDRAPRGVEVATLHSYGYKACMRHFGKLRLDSRRVDSLCEALHGTESESFGLRRALAKCVSLAKGSLAETREDVDALIDRFQIDTGENSQDREEFISDVLTLLVQCREVRGVIDFDDMVWLPVVLRVRTWLFDRVFIDETQDLNPAQIALALMAVKPNGRILAVGDDRQAIYGFRGADQNAVSNVVARLKARVLPLAVTYRCARAIAAEAKTIVPDLEWAPNAEEGEVVRGVEKSTMMRDAKPGDFVLSRSNAPLIPLCMSFLKENRRANIQGRDIGASLVSYIKRSECPMTSLAGVSTFLSYVEEWRAEETKRLDAKGRDTTGVDDRAETLIALCDGAQSLQETLARIDALFSDEGGEKIVLSSTHKAKGLERDRVYLLEDTYRRRPGMEEDNLYYVAVTRARKSLFMVKGIGAGAGKFVPVAKVVRAKARKVAKVPA